MLGIIWNCGGISKKGVVTCVKEFFYLERQILWVCKKL